MSWFEPVTKRLLEGRIQAKILAVRDHVEGFVADHGVQADDADIGRLAEQDVAAHILVFGDLAFFGTAQRGHHIHGGAEALDGLVSVREAVDQGLFIRCEQDGRGVAALPGDDASADEAAGEIQGRQADQ